MLEYLHSNIEVHRIGTSLVDGEEASKYQLRIRALYPPCSANEDLVRSTSITCTDSLRRSSID